MPRARVAIVVRERAPANLVWVSRQSGWHVGDVLLVEARSRQFARVAGHVSDVVPTPEPGPAVGISQLLALTAGAVRGVEIRLELACSGRPRLSLPAATTVDLVGPFEMQDTGRGLRATCTAEPTPQLPRPPLAAALLQGSVVSKGQAVAFEWSGQRQLFVVSDVPGGDPNGARTITSGTAVRFRSGGQLDPGTAAELRMHSVRPRLSPQLLTATEWEEHACQEAAGMCTQIQGLIARLHPVLVGAVTLLPVQYALASYGVCRHAPPCKMRTVHMRRILTGRAARQRRARELI
jgi:hypothetical protein